MELLVTKLMAETVRLTAFPVDRTVKVPTDWWWTIVGGEPEERVVRPREGLHRESGPFQSGAITLQVQFERIDWVVRPRIDGDTNLPDAEESALDSIGPLATAIEHFRAAMTKWLCHSPPLRRLAFGCIAVLPATSREEGYKQLQPYLPSVTIDPDGSQNLSYQINRPRTTKTGIEGLRINRLSKWSVLLRTATKVTLGEEGFGAPMVSPGVNAARIEVDINTAPDFVGPIPLERVIDVWDELVQLGSEVFAKGDVP